MGSEGEKTAGATPVFFKKQSSKKNFRKRPASSQDDEDVEASIESLEELRRMQRERKREKGVAAGVDRSLGEVVVHDEPSKEQKIVSLESNFQTVQNVQVEDTQMQRYIEQEMARKKGITLDEKGSLDKPKTREDELYELPNELKVNKLFDKKPDEEKEDSSRWLTGIMEVNLPVEYKIKNIEETEKAKQRVLMQPKTAASSNIPKNYNANYVSNRPVPGKPRTYEDDPSNAPKGAGGPMNQSSDERVFDRFRKNFRSK